MEWNGMNMEGDGNEMNMKWKESTQGVDDGMECTQIESFIKKKDVPLVLLKFLAKPLKKPKPIKW